MKKSILILAILFSIIGNSQKIMQPQKIEFPSLDGLIISANLYENSRKESQVIVLCHQARYNKYEYNKIAETLLEKGFTCLAIDQRSGGGMIEMFNETQQRAKTQGKTTEFLDAEQDIVAAVDFMNKKYNQKVILWGSSYSSSLALYIGAKNPNVSAIISFSPGEYFEKQNVTIGDKLIHLKIPTFVTSSKEEAPELTKMLEKSKGNKNIYQFIPKSVGAHGSKALWKTDDNNVEYWTAIYQFLLKGFN